MPGSAHSRCDRRGIISALTHPGTDREVADIAIAEFSLEQIKTGSGASFPGLEQRPGKVTVSGDRSGQHEVYVGLLPDRVVIASRLEPISQAAAAAGIQARIAPQAVSHILHDGLVPLPGTVFRSIYRLSVGDTAEVSPGVAGPQIRFTCDYPWLPRKSREDQEPDVDRLHELILASVEQRLARLSGDGLLMMSSGKDSVAIAVALAELGRSPRCLTFKSGADDREHVFAAELCKRLGLEHQTVEMPMDPTSSAASLIRFFEASPFPTADHAAIAYVQTLATSGVTEGACIDGGGNDPYMGYVIEGDSRTKLRYRIRGPRVATAVKRLVPVDSPLNYLARSAAAALLPGRNLRHWETAQFYADAVETDGFWYRESREFQGEGLAAGLTVSRLRHTEAGRSHLKTRLAALAFGLEPVLPFCDAEIADYYFHLPEASRYDRAAGTNKVLLRELLTDQIDYDPARVGDGYFRFDGAHFMETHSEFVRNEIRSCELWGPSVGEMTDRWLDTMSQRPLLWHALYPVFMLSGWHNHSRFAPA